MNKINNSNQLRNLAIFLITLGLILLFIFNVNILPNGSNQPNQNIDEIYILTAFGGSGKDDFQDFDIYDNEMIFVASTASSDMPIVKGKEGSYEDTTYGGGSYYGTDGYIAKYDLIKKEIIYSTYFGGEGDDFTRFVRIDKSNGNYFICGWTETQNIQTMNAIQPNFGGGQGDIFVSKFDLDGRVLFTTYFGGSELESVSGMEFDSNNNLVLIGTTQSIDFPVTDNAFNRTHSGGTNDGVIIKISNDGDLIYSSYLGGIGDDFITDLVIDLDGNLFIQGRTTSENFPTTNEIDNNTILTDGDIFLSKFDNSNNLVFSSLFGGSSLDSPKELKLLNNSLWSIGSTNSDDFPITDNSIQNFNAGGNYDIFVTKFNKDTFEIEFSTYFGGNKSDQAFSFTFDEESNIIITGFTKSVNTDYFQTGEIPYVDSSPFVENMFVLRLSQNGKMLNSYLIGGSNLDRGLKVQMWDNKIIIAGTSTSNEYFYKNSLKNKVGTDYDLIFIIVDKNSFFRNSFSEPGLIDQSGIFNLLIVLLLILFSSVLFISYYFISKNEEIRKFDKIIPITHASMVERLYIMLQFAFEKYDSKFTFTINDKEKILGYSEKEKDNFNGFPRVNLSEIEILNMDRIQNYDVPKFSLEILIAILKNIPKWTTTIEFLDMNMDKKKILRLLNILIELELIKKRPTMVDTRYNEYMLTEDSLIFLYSIYSHIKDGFNNYYKF